MLLQKHRVFVLGATEALDRRGVSVTGAPSGGSAKHDKNTVVSCSEALKRSTGVVFLPRGSFGQSH